MPIYSYIHLVYTPRIHITYIYLYTYTYILIYTSYIYTEWLLPITERWYEPKPEISLAEALKLNPESLIEYDNAKNEENQRKEKYTNIINNIQNNSIWYKIDKINQLSLQSDIKARFDQIFEAEITRYKHHCNLLYESVKGSQL